MKLEIPVSLRRVLVHWYSLSTAIVKWHSVYSYAFQLCCGVRQGGVLSSVPGVIWYIGYVNSLINAPT